MWNFNFDSHLTPFSLKRPPPSPSKISNMLWLVGIHPSLTKQGTKNERHSFLPNPTAHRFGVSYPFSFYPFQNPKICLCRQQRWGGRKCLMEIRVGPKKQRESQAPGVLVGFGINATCFITKIGRKEGKSHKSKKQTTVARFF